MIYNAQILRPSGRCLLKCYCLNHKLKKDTSLLLSAMIFDGEESGTEEQIAKYISKIRENTDVLTLFFRNQAGLKDVIYNKVIYDISVERISGRKIFNSNEFTVIETSG